MKKIFIITTLCALSLNTHSMGFLNLALSGVSGYCAYKSHKNKLSHEGYGTIVDKAISAFRFSSSPSPQQKEDEFQKIVLFFHNKYKEIFEINRDPILGFEKDHSERIAINNCMTLGLFGISVLSGIYGIKQIVT